MCFSQCPLTPCHTLASVESKTNQWDMISHWFISVSLSALVWEYMCASRTYHHCAPVMIARVDERQCEAKSSTRGRERALSLCLADEEDRALPSKSMSSAHVGYWGMILKHQQRLGMQFWAIIFRFSHKPTAVGHEVCHSLLEVLPRCPQARHWIYFILWSSCLMIPLQNRLF